MRQAENEALQELVKQQAEGGAKGAKRLSGLKSKYQHLSTRVRCLFGRGVSPAHVVAGAVAGKDSPVCPTTLSAC